MNLRPYQQPHADRLLSILRARVSAFDGSDCGTGKGQPEGAMILTPRGFVENTNLQIGDLVAASDGLFYPLTGVFRRGVQPVFRFHYSDRSSVLFDRDHLHIVRTNNDRQRGKPWRVLSTTDLVAARVRYGAKGKSRNFDLPVTLPVEWRRVEHFIHPYLLGAILGDGGITASCGITIAEGEMVDRITSFLPSGTELRRWKSRYAYGISSAASHRTQSLIPELRRLRLFGLKSHAKFIPLEYLIDSVEHRVWLLRGLMDTDGYADTSAHFYTTSSRLRDDVIFLIRSLGGVPTYWEKRTRYTHAGESRPGRLSYEVCFSLKTFNPFSLSRKAAKWNSAPRDNGRWLDRIEPAGEAATICVSCSSPDQSYVTENFVVTHNTYCASWLAAQLQRRTLVVCPLSVVPTWEQILSDAGATDFVVTNFERAWRKLCRKVPWGKGSYLEWLEKWPLFIFDEVHRCQSSTTMQGKMLIAATRQARLSGGKILNLSATAADTPLKMKPLGFSLGLHNLDDWLRWLDAHGCPELTLGPKDKPEKQWTERIFLKGRQDEVMAKLNADIYETRGSRLRIADIPDFPVTQIDVRLLAGHEREVQRLSEELRAFYTNRRALAAGLEKMEDDHSMLAKMTYARQAMEVAKVPALADMIEDALETSRVAVFCNYSATLDALAAECAKNKWKFGFVRGEQSVLARQNTIQSFQADNLDVALCNVQAGGVGVSLHSLQRTPRTALICPTYSAVDLRQATGRVHRDGGGPSIQHIVFFRGTVEEEVANSVQKKLARLDLLNDGDLDPVVEQATLAI